MSHQPKTSVDIKPPQKDTKGYKRYKGVSPRINSEKVTSRFFRHAGLAALLASLVWDWILIPTQPSRTMVPFVARSGCGTGSQIGAGGMIVFRVESW